VFHLRVVGSVILSLPLVSVGHSICCCLHGGRVQGGEGNLALPHPRQYKCECCIIKIRNRHEIRRVLYS